MTLRLRLSGMVVLVLLAVLGPSVAQADDFGQPVSGQHVYDRASLLTQDQVRMIEARASSLDRMGAPTVVFIQVKSATQEQAQQDARDLMDTWNVQSATNAHDGFVMLLDLNPSDTHHGEVGLFSGAAHQLGSSELNRIASEVMRLPLSSGDLAGGITAGLDATANDIQNGTSASSEEAPPQPRTSAASGFDPVRWVFNNFFFVVLALVIFTWVRRLFFGGGYRRGSGSGGFWSSDSGGFSSSSSDSGSSASSGGDSGGSSF